MLVHPSVHMVNIGSSYFCILVHPLAHWMYIGSSNTGVLVHPHGHMGILHHITLVLGCILGHLLFIVFSYYCILVHSIEYLVGFFLETSAYWWIFWHIFWILILDDKFIGRKTT